MIQLNRVKNIKYDFWTYVPDNIDSIKNIVFHFHGSIRFRSDENKYLYSEVESNFKTGISLFPNCIVITPCLPRVYGEAKVTTSAQDFSIDTMLKTEIKKKNSIYNRADLEVLKIIDYINEIYAIDNKMVIVSGVSAGACIANIFSILHPDLVNKCISIVGGIYPIVFGEISNKLKYPFGTNNISEIETIEFNIAAIKNINYFIYEGEKDNNDPVFHYADYDMDEMSRIEECLGKTRTERAKKWCEIMNSNGVVVESHFIEDMEHKVDDYDKLGKLVRKFIG